jgi:glucose/arabinose dehydrogenase
MRNATRIGRRSRLMAVFMVTSVLALAGLPSGLGPALGASPGVTPLPAPISQRFLGGSQPAKQLTRAQVAAAATLPSGFQDNVVFSGLTQPTAIRFSPDGRIFVAEKSGLIKVFSSLTATTPTIFADLRGEVDNYWDRGLLGMTLAPNFPTDPSVYVLYAFDAMIGGTAPVWNDACPTPPGPTTDGCVISGRLSRLTASGNVMTGTEQVLINAWCQQFPSHSVGDLFFGADGALYVSDGDGASFDGIDYGQLGGTTGTTPSNPCGDPPGGVGGSMTPPTAEGGSLRSQSVRRPTGQPVTLNGALLRVDPATGLAKSDNPLAGQSNLNAQRIVGFGFRNPFRFTIRPGTNEVWIGDVGDSTWEEIDRIPDPTVATVANGGWPCYEGPAKAPNYTGLNISLCTSLYATPTGLLTPYFTYNHSSTVVPGESCPYTNGSSISGLAFYQGGAYPTSYNGALVFADHSRNCMWIMSVGSNGLPNPGSIQTLVAGASNPVDVEAGPGGDIFYVDFDLGAIHRITYTASNNAPTAVILPSATSGASPLTVSFDGSTSYDPDPGDTISYSWDNGDGTFGDATTPTASFTYTTAGVYNVRLRVTDSHGASNTATVQINVDNTLPVPIIDTPLSTLTYAVGDPIAFSGHATDSSHTTLPAADLSWTLIIHHCPTLAGCHTHFVQTFSGVASGSLNAPDHGYPSYLELDLTATDSAGHTATTSVRLNPKTVTFTMNSVPSGLSLIVGVNTPLTTPFTSTFIANSAESLIASTPQTLGGKSYAFSSWSDSGAATHGVTAPLTGNATYTATYTSTSTTAYLSDLAYTVVANGWGPVEKDTSNGEQAAGDGHPITLNGVVYAKGLGAHAPSDIRYAMNGTCTTFSVKVGVDDESTSPIASVDFQIFADGTKLADTGTMGATSATQSLSVDVTARTTLQLVVTDAGDGNESDHADWANAQLTCSS